MNDDDLNRALRELPREAASSGFTRRVLARLDEAPRPIWRRPLVLAPMAAALVATLLTWSLTGHRKQERRARLAELRQEQQQLAAELAALKDQADSREVLYLGGDEGIDIVMDLARLAERRPGRDF